MTYSRLARLASRAWASMAIWAPTLQPGSAASMVLISLLSCSCSSHIVVSYTSRARPSRQMRRSSLMACTYFETDCCVILMSKSSRRMRAMRVGLLVALMMMMSRMMDSRSFHLAVRRFGRGCGGGGGASFCAVMPACKGAHSFLCFSPVSASRRCMMTST